MITVEVVSPPDNVALDWAALVERIGGSPFLEPGWVLAWHRAFGRGRLMIVAARRHDRLVAALPLVMRAGAIRSPANWHTPEYGIAAEDNDAATTLLSAVLERTPRSVALRFIDRGTAAAVQATAEHLGFHVLSRVLERSPYVSIRGRFEEYERRLGNKRHSDLARRRRRLEDLGPMRLDVGTDASAEALTEFARLEESGWKAGDAVARDARVRGFYTEIAHWAAGRGLLRMAFLRAGDRAVAADLAIETRHRHYLLKTGYDPAYRRFAPGILLRYAMLERAFAADLESYEFLGTDEPWKLEWTDLVRDRLVVQVFAPTPAGRLEHRTYVHGRPLARAIMSRGRAWLPRKRDG